MLLAASLVPGAALAAGHSAAPVVVHNHPSGRDIVVGTLGAGHYFGEISLLQHRPRTATVRAISPVEVMALDRGAFHQLLDDSIRQVSNWRRSWLIRLIALAHANADER